MDRDELYRLTSRADEFARASRIFKEHLGLNQFTSAAQFREAQEHLALGSQFVTGMGGLEKIQALSSGMEEWRRQEQMRAMMEGSASSIARAALGYPDSPVMRAAMGYMDSPTMRAALGYHNSDSMRAARGVIDTASITMARDLADRAHGLSLPKELSAFQTTTASLAERLSLLNLNASGMSSGSLEAFARSAAMSDALAFSTRVDRSLIDAAHAYTASAMPDLGTLAAHRSFLDASGLWLPRWPKVRLLTLAEKRRRFRARLQRNAQSPHAARAKSMVHQYERVLREVIDAAMEVTYGEDWAQERLPECGCKTLLGKAANRGGHPLDHADYAHYRDIMSHPEHHAEVFSVAFEDADALARLIDEAGRLRARSHHAGDFGPGDLRDLRVVWRTLQNGLLSLLDYFEFHWDD